MDKIQKSCLPTTILCLGGRSPNDVLLVVSCGSCSVFLSKTVQNTPNFMNGAYWYYIPDVSVSRSMGFAPNSNINQQNTDRFDLDNNQRVSWQLNDIHNDYRLGSLINLNNSLYYKVILKKDL
jgi:hypothetical protein